MNWKNALMAVTLIALFLAAYMPAIPVKAFPGETETGVTVLTKVVTVDNRIYFVINLTKLRQTFSWVGTTVDIYVSINGYSTISDNKSIDYPVVKGIYTVGVDNITGTIYINKTIVNTLLGGENGYLYLKFYDGSNVAASNRFYVVTNITEVFTLNTYNLSMTGYSEPGFSSNSTLDFLVNLTGIVDPGFNLTKYNVSIVLFNNIPDNRILYDNSNAVNTTDLANMTSDILNLTSVNITNTTLHFTGDLINFSLAGANAYATIHGIVVGYESFAFSLEASNGTIALTNVVWVTDNTTDNTIQPTATVNNVSLNIGSLDKRLNVFPSVELKGYTELSGRPEINPGDAITVTLYNFVGVSDEVIICLFIEGDGKLVSIPTGTSVDTTYGNATITVTLPEAQYGGRQFFIAAKQADIGVRGLPATNATVASGPSIIIVKPFIDVAFVYNNGTFKDFNTESNTAPGDYVLVKGHGFIQENITVYIEYLGDYVGELQFLVDHSGADSIHVYDNGTFFSMLKMPIDVDTTQQPFELVAVGDTPTDKGYSIITFNYDLTGAVYKVFVNPQPIIYTGSGFTEDAGYVAQTPVNPAYPAETPWISDLDGYSNFTVEVIGVPFTSGSISLTPDNTTYYKAIDVTFTNGYYMSVVDVPTIPYGDYYVAANDITTAYGSYQKMVLVRETARAIDPVDLELYNRTVYVTQVRIGEAINITVVGYGWPGAATLVWEIQKDGTAKTYSETFTTNADGTFEIEVNISGFLFENGEGNYTLTIYDPTNPSISEEIKIYYKVTPELRVEVHTGTLKLTYPGDSVDVYAIIWLGNDLLKPEDVSNLTVKISVYSPQADSTLIKVIDAENMTYTGVKGVWHFRFNVSPAELGFNVKGQDLLIKVCVTVQPEVFMIPRSQVVFTSITVAYSLEHLLNETISQIKAAKTDIIDNITAAKEEILRNVSEMLNELNLTLTEIDGRLMLVSETLNMTYADVSYLVMLVESLNANVSLVYTEVVNTAGLIENSTEEINNNLAVLYLAITAYGDAILANLTTVLANQNTMMGDLETILENQGIILVKLDAALDQLGAILEAINNNTAIIRSDINNATVYIIANMTMLAEDLNASITQVLQKGDDILLEINTTAGVILAKIDTARDLIVHNITVAKEEILASIANLSADLSGYAEDILADLGIIKANLTKLDTILSAIKTAETNVTSAIDAKATQITNTVNAAKTSIQQSIDDSTERICNKLDLISTKVDNSTASITDLINSKASEISGKLDTLSTTLSQKIDNTTKTLTDTITENNNAIKGRVTTMTSLSTVVLLAAIIAVGFITTRRPG